MKKFFLMNLLILVSFNQVVVCQEKPAGYLNWLHTAAGSAIAPFQAGYWEPEAKKAAARAAIIELEKKRAEILKTGMGNLVPELQDKLREIEVELYQQKLITGEVWSRERKIGLSMVALGTIALLGFGIYKQLYKVPPTAGPINVLKSNEKINDSERYRAAEEKIAEKYPYKSPDLVEGKYKDDPAMYRERYVEINDQRGKGINGL